MSSEVALEPERPSLDTLCAERFGIQTLRAWQREAVEAILGDPGRVLVVAPTGGGKSLCYQLPALALPGTALVLSPLISLMEDQVRALEARGIAATFLASTLPREETGRRLAGLVRGDYAIVYAAPERLASDGFLRAIESATLSLVAIDEAHCIVQWGHDFRPEYLRIGAALERLRPRRIMACTATATPTVRDEILTRLGMEGAPVVLRGFARPNLHLGVVHTSGPSEALAEAAAALRRNLGAARAPEGAGIVYTATRKSAEKIAGKLCESGWDARAYHAGMAPEERASVSADFAARTLSVVVATNAFGMGIDRPDVRVVVHAQPPASLEAYYQEVGRAGRDGAAAEGVLLVSPYDIALRRRLCELGSDGGAPAAELVQRAWSLFRELLRYVDAATCRHDFILRYFGDEAESLGGCGHCDACREALEAQSSDPARLARNLELCRKALSGVARARERVGLGGVVAMLRGVDDARVRRLALDGLSTYGILRSLSEPDVMAIMRVLLAAGWIDLTPTEFPVPVVTSRGWKVMRGDEHVAVLLPIERAAPARARAPATKKSRAARSATPRAPVEPGAVDLVTALKAQRAKLAREIGVPAYVIAHDRTLEEIASRRPTTLVELADVHGMGPARISRYGEAFLEALRTAS